MTEPSQPSTNDAQRIVAELWWLAWYGTVAPGLRASILLVMRAAGEWMGVTVADDPIPPDPPANPDQPPEPPPPPPQPAYPMMAIEIIDWLAYVAPLTQQGDYEAASSAYGAWATP